MARSMTGYGRADFAIGPESFSVEIKALNHRYIDISVRMPDRFFAIENMLRAELKKRFSRGSVSVFINSVSHEQPPMRLNLPLARVYLEAADELKKILGVKGEADVAAILKLKDIFSFERKGPVTDADWPPVAEALERACGQAEEWRVKEGAALKEDLLARLSSVEGLLFHVEARGPKALEAYRARLTDEMERLIGSRIDEARILHEAAIFAERSDINEETVRLKSHLDLFRKYMKFDEPVGKRLDFLCQEIGREINTIGSKSTDVKITQTVVEMKGEVEKIREQVQNVE